MQITPEIEILRSLRNKEFLIRKDSRNYVYLFWHLLRIKALIRIFLA